LEATPAQHVRLAVSTARADAAVKRVKEIDPAWRPRPSLHETVEGAITANERVVQEAEGRLNELGRSSIFNYQTSRELLVPLPEQRES
jgi:hypothetical protein